MYCKQCGKQIKDDLESCPFCGALQHEKIQKGFYKKRKFEKLSLEYEKARTALGNQASQAAVEELVRKTVMKKKLKNLGWLYILGSVVIAIGSVFLESSGTGNNLLDIIVILLILAGGPGVVFFCVFKFALCMHEPLTPAEAAELKKKDAIEKGGATVQQVVTTSDDPIELDDVPRKNSISIQKIREHLTQNEIKKFTDYNLFRNIALAWCAIWILIAFFVTVVGVSLSIDGQVVDENIIMDMLVMSATFFMAGSIPLVFLIGSYIEYSRRLKHLKTVPFKVKTDTVSNKEDVKIITRDGDPPDVITTYHALKLAKSGAAVKAGRSIFERINIGDIVYTVHIDQSPEICKWYSANDFIFSEEDLVSEEDSEAKVALNREAIKDELIKKERSNFIERIKVRIAAKIWIAWSAIFFALGFSWGLKDIILRGMFTLLGGVPLILLIRSYVKHFRRLRTLKNGDICIRAETVVNKKKEELEPSLKEGDIELTDSEYFILLDQSEAELKVPKDLFMNVNDGDEVYTVRIGASSDIVKIYSSNTHIFTSDT